MLIIVKRSHKVSLIFRARNCTKCFKNIIFFNPQDSPSKDEDEPALRMFKEKAWEGRDYLGPKVRINLGLDKGFSGADTNMSLYISLCPVTCES